MPVNPLPLADQVTLRPQLIIIMQLAIVRSELVRHRVEKAGVAQIDVANELVWSRSKMIRMETGVTQLAPSDVRNILNRDGADAEERDMLVKTVHVQSAKKCGNLRSLRYTTAYAPH